VTLAGVELMHMIRKGQLGTAGENVSRAAILFVGWINPDIFLDLAYSPGKFATEPKDRTRPTADVCNLGSTGRGWPGSEGQLRSKLDREAAVHTI
jgi:hypothetical protein